MAKNRNVEIIAGTSFIWKGKLVRAGTKIKVPEEFYLREIALQTKRGAKLHKLVNNPEPVLEDDPPPPPPHEEPPPVSPPPLQPDGSGSAGDDDDAEDGAF